MKLEGYEMWLGENKIEDGKRREQALESVHAWICKNASSLKLMYFSEDESFPVGFKALEQALANARTSELEAFVDGKKSHFAFEDGYIQVRG